MIAAFRAQQAARLQAVRHDVLVVGGGIVGAGVARDAALRGLRVALIEQGDFAGGTSSKTSKLIHGGLRYLEHGHVRLVYESLRERGVLRTIAPGLVHPRSLLLPVYRGDRRPLWTIRAGLWLYDRLAGTARVQPHRMLSPARAAALVPPLRVEGLRGAGVYADCAMDDARLCLLNILQAAQFSAVCVNYVRLREFLRAGDRICGAVVEDRLTGGVAEIQARVVVNATGPWADAVRRLNDAASTPRMAPTKGIHLVVPRLAQEALFVEARRDGRMVFLLPWGDQTLIGTTESPVDGPLDALQARADEAGYLLEEANRVLPGSHLTPEDVITTFAGARPLHRFDGSATGATREHRVEVERHGLISVTGGKYTTYRVMARDTMDHVLRQLGGPREGCLTDRIGLLEAPGPVSREHWCDAVETVDPDTVERLITRYGVGAIAVLQRMRAERWLAQPVCPHSEQTAAELAHAIEREWACTVTDLLARRTRLAWGSCRGRDALPVATEVLRRFGGLDAATVAAQVEAYERFLADGVAFRTSTSARTPGPYQEAPT